MYKNFGLMYKYALKINKMIEKCKIKVSLLKYLLHKSNYVLGMCCYREPEK